MTCKVIEGVVPGEWRIVTTNEDGSYETVGTFLGPDARLRAINYARHRFGEFDEITLQPHRR